MLGRWSRNKAERELDEEMRFHLDMETEKLIARGVPPAEARRRARVAFGGVEVWKEACRDVRRGRTFEMLVHDVRWALRSIRRAPGYALAVILTLALGMGANTAIFSVVNGILLQPLPYADDDSLVLLRQQAIHLGVDNLAFSIRELYDVQEQSSALSAIAEYHSMSFTLLGREEPMRVRTGVVSASYFPLLGVKPVLGRDFRPTDEHHGAEAVLMLSHGFWQRSFGGDPDIVGQVFEMNDKPHTVVGVLPPIPQFPRDNDVYMPTLACPFRAAGEENMVENRRSFSSLVVIGRLAPGKTLTDAETETAVLADRFRQLHPDIYEDAGYDMGVVLLKEELVREARPTLLLLLATALLVLIIACANVANLTVAQRLRRDRELAVRVALGAGRGHLIRQQLTQSLVLAGLGALLGLALAYSGLGILKSFAGRFTPRGDNIEIDMWVLLFTLIAAVLTGVLTSGMAGFGTRGRIASALRGSRTTTANPGRLRLRALLVTAQVAVSVVLLVIAGLTLRSLLRMQSVDPGFDSSKVVTARVLLNWSIYNEHQDQVRFFETALDELARQPGVSTVAAASDLPIRGSRRPNQFMIEGQQVDSDELRPVFDFRSATPDYFQAVGIPLIKGRNFGHNDHEAAPYVAVINQTMAKRYFADRDPIGQRVAIGDLDNEDPQWHTIVGVVGDVHDYGPDLPATEQLYVPFRQDGSVQYLVLRTDRDLAASAVMIKDVVYGLDPQQPVIELQTLEAAQRTVTDAPRLTSTLLGLFALLALAITATGLSGVIAFAVGQRRNEIGIRMALGARRSTVVLMILRQGLSLVSGGLLIGLGLAFLSSQRVADLLFEIPPSDPPTFTG
ncbi:MAG: ABC transporter permease, partial [Acidobacteriota bacterium]